LAVLYFYNSSYRTPTRIALADNVGLTGFAWSSNIGWIQMDGHTDPVVVNSDNKSLSGFAWSSNTGWIKFNPDGPFPTVAGDGTTASVATLVAPTTGTVHKLVGWARACSVFQSGCSGALKTDTGGWDGWISLIGNNYGVKFDNNGTNTNFAGFAWGADVLGWIDFSRVEIPSSSLNLIFGVQSQPDFTLTNDLQPLRLNFVTDNAQTSNEIEIRVVRLNDFAGTVSGYEVETLAIGGKTIDTSPPPINTSVTPVKLKIRVGKISTGTYNISVKATSGSLTRRVNVPVIVNTVARGIKEI